AVGTVSNFGPISQTPFDCTITFCEVQPLSEDEIRTLNAATPGADMVVRAPVRARVVVPFQVLPNLIAALQEQLRNVNPAPGGPVHRGRRGGSPSGSRDPRDPRSPLDATPRRRY